MVKWRCRGNEIVIEGSSEQMSLASGYILPTRETSVECRTLKANPGNSGIINDMQNREIHLIDTDGRGDDHVGR